MSPIIYSRFTFRTFLTYLIVALIIVGFVLYVLFQARLIIAGPQIAVTSSSGSSQGRLVTLEGSARNIVQITLNGRQIYTDKDGNFKEALILENGYTIATLQAQDRYGRSIRHTETYVYAPNDNGADESVIN